MSRLDLRRLASEHVQPREVPRAPTDRVVYGLVQPLVGARLLLGDRPLLGQALVPVGLVAAACAVYAVLQADTPSAWEVLRHFYTSFAVLAPLPSVIMANHDARLAVAARHALGFPRAEPCLLPMRVNLGRALKQAALIALALAPVGALLRVVPVLGTVLLQVVSAIWGLHWIFVDAFDSARYLRPGQTVADLDAHARTLPSPWFVRALLRASKAVPIVGGLIGRFARLCDRLAMPWREEIALVENHPSLTLGFALGTAAVLAVPGVNLLFRPIVITGAAHVLGRLEQLEPDAPVLPPKLEAELATKA